jgi:hypothetical protein
MSHKSANVYHAGNYLCLFHLIDNSYGGAQRVPESNSGQSRKVMRFLECSVLGSNSNGSKPTAVCVVVVSIFTFKDGNDRLSRNVGKKLPLLAA